ncbi:signal peptidase I [Streptomyces sp. ISL-98]|uniref:signal peptidase I n=1 Tax=Streptomyces sp. ISL-98 TaxID=2819192 RepID=UPI001BE7BCC1|nr:signal peptidase I [Streptomyces sp. ISL-98]MBT2509640.1 signal peptidase I [Streptomyces sp. ISL-98]
MAVGARSERNEPEERPESPAAVKDDVRNVENSSNGENSDGSGGDSSAGEADAGGKKPRSFWKELPLLIGIALLLALLIKTFLVQAFSIPSDSMQNTLQRGDRVLVDKLTPWFGSEPERGEVVVFHDPGGWLENTVTPDPNVVQKFLSFIGLMPSAEEKDLIKRVIAVGGDTVECKKNGPVTVNGKALDEKSYIFPGDTPCNDEPFGPLKVPDGRIWVMGDHRQNSLDSRYHQELPGEGTVSNDEVVGRAVVVAWPLDRWSTLPVPDTFDQAGLNAAAVATSAAPGALGLAGAVPLVIWRRRRLTGGRTAG